MNQFDTNNFHDTAELSGGVPTKRKRGRPRKYPKPDVADDNQISRNQNLNQNSKRGVQSHVLPVSNGATVNAPPWWEPVNANKAMIGQAVSGVVEAVFDAGFLLSVKVGDSDTTLRGVVFRPGRYVTVTPENDVAPDVQMIKRIEVPFPSGSYAEGDKSHMTNGSMQNVKLHRNETRPTVGLPATNLVSKVASSSNVVPAKEKQDPVVAEQTLLPASRGGTILVGHQDLGSSNVVTVSDQPSVVMSQASHVLSTEGNVVKEPSKPGKGAATIVQFPIACSQSPVSQLQPSSTVVMQNEESHLPSSDGQRELEAKTEGSPSQRFQKLCSEAFKIVQPSPQTTECVIENTNASSNTLGKDAKVDQEDRAKKMDQTPAIPSLQTPEPHLVEGLSTAPSKTSDTRNTDRMNELLQVLQDESEKQEREAGDLPSQNPTEPNSQEKEADDAETG